MRTEKRAADNSVFAIDGRCCIGITSKECGNLPHVPYLASKNPVHRKYEPLAAIFPLNIMKHHNFNLTDEQQRVFENLKLSIELVPITCWHSNVRSKLTRPQWNKLRTTIFEERNHKCEICGGIGTKHPLECHEVWFYDNKNKTQSLIKLTAICPLCHQVKHLGLTSKLGSEYRERAIQRFQEINNLTIEDSTLYISYFWQQWKERNKHEWKLDISLLESYSIDIEATKFNAIDRNHFSDEMKLYASSKVLSNGILTNSKKIANEKVELKCPKCESKEIIKYGEETLFKKFRCVCHTCKNLFVSTS